MSHPIKYRRMHICSCMNGMGCKKKKGNRRALPELGAAGCVLGVSIPAPIKFMIFSICLKSTDSRFFYICLKCPQLTLLSIIMFRSTLIQNVPAFFFFSTKYLIGFSDLYYSGITESDDCRAKCSMSGLQNKSTKSCLGLWMKEY